MLAALQEQAKMQKIESARKALQKETNADAVLAGLKKMVRCDNCHVHGKDAKLRACSGCQEIFYCSDKCQLAHWPVHKPLCAAARAQQVKREELTASNPSGRAMFQELNAYIQLAISEIQQAFVYALKLGHPDSLHTTHAPYIRFVYDPAGKTLRQKFTLGEGSQGDVLPTEDIIDRLLETNPHTLSRAQLQQSFNQSWLKERTKVARPSAFRHPFGAMFQVVLKSDVLKWGVGHPHAPVTASAVHPFNIDMSEEKTIMAQPPKAPTEWMKMLRYTNVLPSPPERPELDILYGCIASGNADTFKSYYTTHRKRQLASTAPMQPGVDGSLIRAQMEIVVLYIEKIKPALAAWQDAARRKKISERKKEAKRAKSAQEEVFALAGGRSAEPPHLTLAQRSQLFSFFNEQANPDMAAVSKEIQYTDTGFSKIGSRTIRLEFTSLDPLIAYKLYHRYADKLPPPPEPRPSPFNVKPEDIPVEDDGDEEWQDMTKEELALDEALVRRIKGRYMEQLLELKLGVACPDLAPTPQESYLDWLLAENDRARHQ